MIHPIRINKYQPLPGSGCADLIGELSANVTGQQFNTMLAGASINVFRYRKSPNQTLHFSYESTLPLLVHPDLGDVTDLTHCDGELLVFYPNGTSSVSSSFCLGITVGHEPRDFSVVYSGLSNHQMLSLYQQSLLSLANRMVVSQSIMALAQYDLRSVIAVLHLALVLQQQPLYPCFVFVDDQPSAEAAWSWYLKFLFGAQSAVWQPASHGDIDTSLNQYLAHLTTDELEPFARTLNRNADLIPAKLFAPHKSL